MTTPITTRPHGAEAAVSNASHGSPGSTRARRASGRVLSTALSALAMGALAAVVLPATASAGDLPWLPGTFDTSWSPPSGGNVLNVPAGGDFQGALNAANPGDTIVLEAGATYVGPFTLPYKGGAWAWIYVVSSNYAQLPGPGSRVSPADAVNMPVLVAPYLEPAVQSTDGSHHFRFVGIEFTNTPGAYTYNLVQLDNSDTSPATLTHDITFDRCFFFAEPTAPGVRRGLLMNGAYV